VNEACPDCQHAARSCWAIYRSACPSCRARSAARSLAAFNALHPKGNGQREPLGELADRLLPEVEAQERRRMVVWWWRQDREVFQKQEPSMDSPTHLHSGGAR
jgi:hypothetical protein